MFSIFYSLFSYCIFFHMVHVYGMVRGSYGTYCTVSRNHGIFVHGFCANIYGTAFKFIYRDKAINYYGDVTKGRVPTNESIEKGVGRRSNNSSNSTPLCATVSATTTATARENKEGRTNTRATSTTPRMVVLTPLQAALYLKPNGWLGLSPIRSTR